MRGLLPPITPASPNAPQGAPPAPLPHDLSFLDALREDAGTIGGGIKHFGEGLLENIKSFMDTPVGDEEASPRAFAALAPLTGVGSAPEGALGALIGSRARTWPTKLANPIARSFSANKFTPADFVKRVEDSPFELGPTGRMLKLAKPMPNLALSKNLSGLDKLGDALTGADDLFAAYPDMADILLALHPGMGETVKGRYLKGDLNTLETIGLSPKMSMEEVLPTIRHEIQHGIQHREDWPGGYNVDAARQSIEQARNDFVQHLMQGHGYEDRQAKIAAIWAGHRNRPLPTALQDDSQAVRLFDRLQGLGIDPGNAYLREIGEQEARAASRMGRADVTPESSGPPGWGAIEGHGFDPSRPIYDAHAHDTPLAASFQGWLHPAYTIDELRDYFLKHSQIMPLGQ